MNIKKQGFLQALGVTLYCSLVGLFIYNANSIVGKINNLIGPALFLLLFSTSALICAVIVFWKPYKLFTKDKKKEALEVVISTTLWLFVFLLVFFLALVIFK